MSLSAFLQLLLVLAVMGGAVYFVIQRAKKDGDL
jgi:preprotein translocase subunit YajC